MRGVSCEAVWAARSVQRLRQRCCVHVALVQWRTLVVTQDLAGVVFNERARPHAQVLSHKLCMLDLSVAASEQHMCHKCPAWCSS